MNLKLSILQVLNLAKPYMMPPDALRAEVEARHQGRVGDGEFSLALTQLHDKGLVDHQVNNLTGDRKWRITDAGAAELKH